MVLSVVTALYCPSTVKSEGEYALAAVWCFALPRHFVPVGPNYLEIHKLIALQAAYQYWLFQPTVKPKPNFNGFAHPEELF